MSIFRFFSSPIFSSYVQHALHIDFGQLFWHGFESCILSLLRQVGLDTYTHARPLVILWYLSRFLGGFFEGAVRCFFPCGDLSVARERGMEGGEVMDGGGVISRVEF